MTKRHENQLKNRRMQGHLHYMLVYVRDQGNACRNQSVSWLVGAEYATLSDSVKTGDSLLDRVYG